MRLKELLIKSEISEDKYNTDKQKFSLSMIISTTIYTIAFIAQIILMFIVDNEMALGILIYCGWIIWLFSLYFSLITFRIFKKRGKVPKGKNYMNTTVLVDKGAYAIIRHPQYLGGILFAISIVFLTQIWLTLVLCIVITILSYHWAFVEEKNLVEKFGNAYKEYRKRISRLNPVLGIIKYLQRKISD